MNSIHPKIKFTITTAIAVAKEFDPEYPNIHKYEMYFKDATKNKYTKHRVKYLT